VQADLEAAGYEVWPYVLPAASVGAPHRRDRVWFVAYNQYNGDRRREQQQESEQEANTAFKNTRSNGCSNGEYDKQISKRNEWEFGTGSEERIFVGEALQYATNTKNIGRKDALENGELERGRFGQSNKRNFWDSFPSQSPICGGNDGFSTKVDGITFSKWRNESIKAFGNAIVPQVAYQIFKAIEEYGKQRNGL
jgi:DNA (cytosine-5)-methyltransferase 1